MIRTTLFNSRNEQKKIAQISKINNKIHGPDIFLKIRDNYLLYDTIYLLYDTKITLKL